MPPTVNIIGAGIAGLSAGIYLQMNGFDTTIFELHDLPGGLCTSWKRNGYTVDGCLHWVVGSTPEDPLYEVWNEVIDMKSMTFVEYDEFFRVVDRQGGMIRAFTELDALEKELLQKAPEDTETVSEFIQAVRKLSALKMPVGKPAELMGFLDGIRQVKTFLPYMGLLNKWKKITAGEFAERCRTPLLRRFFELAFLPEISMVFVLFVFVWMNRRSAGYPVGGSLHFARQLEQRYLELRGKIMYNKRVTQILTAEKDDVLFATGVRTQADEEYPADYTVSAADGHSTLFDMLGCTFLDQKVKYYYRKFSVFPSLIQVSIGVNRDLSGLPGTVYFELEEPLAVDPSVTADFLGYKIYNSDPTLAPPGKTLIGCMLGTYHYEYWLKLRKKDPEKYAAVKQQLADQVIGRLDAHLGGIREHVEMVSIATPATIIRYTGNWKGSFEGWLMNRETGLKPMRKTLPGLERFYMAGQWVEPGGGVPACLISGRQAAQLICSNEKKRFTTTHF